MIKIKNCIKSAMQTHKCVKFVSTYLGFKDVIRKDIY
jgi:hypothetical protein